MNIRSLRLAVLVTAAFVPGPAGAQHVPHQAAAPRPSTDLGQCARAQPVVDNIIAVAMNRLESARQSNNPAEMRAAVDRLEAALRDIRTQLAPCSSATAAADPQAGHTMPGMQQPPVTPAPAAPMDHSKMPMGGEPKPGTVMDPVNGRMVDPATSFETTYQGQTYHFSSEQTRKEFMQNPAKYAKKPKA
jgi:YHS domain-containing protein